VNRGFTSCIRKAIHLLRRRAGVLVAAISSLVDGFAYSCVNADTVWIVRLRYVIVNSDKIKQNIRTGKASIYEGTLSAIAFRGVAGETASTIIIFGTWDRVYVRTIEIYVEVIICLIRTRTTYCTVD
jgi:hypothetical protein